MTVTYFKRYRMQIDLNSIDDVEFEQHDRYDFLPWKSSLVADHAQAKYLSFCNELDSHVFPCLGDLVGCRQLMREISCRKGFVPEATWLLVYRDRFNNHVENCGTVQGIRESLSEGSIQNLGIVPEHRGYGLGTALLIHSLAGFRRLGIERVRLEVTAHNEGALKLYRQLGFATTKIVFKSIDLAYQ